MEQRNSINLLFGQKAGFGARPQAVGGITSKKKKITERDP